VPSTDCGSAVATPRSYPRLPAAGIAPTEVALQREIGRELYIGDITVKTHITHMSGSGYDLALGLRRRHRRQRPARQSNHQHDPTLGCSAGT
jgi:hypothetical protein